MMRALPFARRRPVIEEVEPRILYSADFSPVLLDPASATPVTEHRTIDASGEFIGLQSVDQQVQRHEVAFVDTATPDYQKLVDDMRAQAGPERRLDVVLIDADTDGVEKIGATLAGMQDVSAVHLIGHGSDGEVHLGATTLDFDTLLHKATQIKGWGQALSTDADLLIYGCDVARAASGRSLMEALSRLTGADVAASDDPTGSKAKGGDWDLEYRIGTIETALAVSGAQQTGWDGLLDAAPQTPAVDPAVASVPLAFEQNQGQVDAQIDFVARGSGYAVGLSGGGAILALDDGTDTGGNVVQLNVVGANPAPGVAGEDLQQGKTNYLVGDQSQWITDVDNFGAVRYNDIYDGVDLRYYGNQRQLEYDFLVDAGASVDAIKLRFDGVQDVSIDADGNLVLRLDDSGRSLAFKAPVAYQDGDGGREAVASRYVIGADGTVGFEVGSYDASRTLVIDPVLSYGSYFGTSGSDVANGIAVDAAGNVYMTGYIPATTGLGGLLGLGAGDQVFVTKLSPTLGTALYTTVVGGSNDDYGTSIAVDSAGNAYVSGYTTSNNFPTLTPYQAARNGAQDAFVFKLDSTGAALVYSTYLGGTGAVDIAWGIAVDAAGSAYVAGAAGNANFPTTVGAADTTFNGNEAFLAKFSASGALVYSTFIGGTGGEVGYGVAVDAAGSAVVVGSTAATNLATVNAYRTTSAGGTDAFIAKVNSAGTAFTYLSYLGGSGADIAYNVTLDASGKIYVTGETSSSNFSLSSNPFKATRSGATDAFVSVIDPSLSGAATLVYSTYLGGTNNTEAGLGIGVDAGGRIYVTGQTNSTDFSVTSGAYKTTVANANGDAFFVILNPVNTGTGDLVYGTYFGGTNADYGNIGAYSNGKFYIAGDTASSSGIATTGTYDTSQNGGSDAFVAVFSIAPTVTTTTTALAYNESSGAKAIDTALVVSDPGIVSLAGAVVQITGNYVNGEDILDFVTQLGITGSWNAATGTLTLTGTTSAANYQTALRAVTYQNTSEKPNTSTRTISVTVSDGVLTSTIATRSVTVTSLNDPPVNTVPPAQNVPEDGALVFSAANGNAITFADVDATSLSVTVTVTNGTLTLGATTSTSITVSGTLASLNTALDGLIYTPTANFNGAASVQVVSNDLGATGSDGAKSDTDTITVNVIAVNDAPVLTGSNNLAAISEDAVSNGGTLVSVLISGKVSDVDASAAGGIAVVGVDETNGVWQYSTNGGGAWSALTGASTTSARLLAANSSTYVRFVPNSNFSGTVPAGITFHAWDQSSGAAGGTADTSVTGGTTAFSTASASAGITVSGANDAPINTVPATQSTNEDTPLVFSTANGNQIAVSDPDAGSASLQISLSVSSGKLTLSQVTGLTFVTGSGVGSSAMTFTGNLSDINAALDGLRFDPSTNFAGSLVLTLVTNDQGNSGTGGALTATSTVTIGVQPVNDAPVNAVPGTQSTQQNTPLVFSSAGGNAITVSDIDAGSSLLSVNLSAANGVLTLGTTAGLAAVTGDGTASLLLSGTQAAINAALEGMRFDPDFGYSGGASITIVTDDQGNSGSGGALATSTVVGISVSSDLSPVVTTTATPTTYTENDPAIVVDAALTVSDPDSLLLDHATVRVTSGYVAGEDLLQFTNTASITGSWDASSGTLTLTAGAGASVSDFRNALRSVTYRNLSDDPGSVSRSISFAVNDGVADSPIASRTIDIVAVNDAPAHTVPAAQSIDEDGNLVFSLALGNAIAIDDPDAGSNSVEVHIEVTDGVLTLAQSSGITFVSGSDGSDAMTLAGNLDDINAALNGLRFDPDADFNGTAQLQIDTDDQGASGGGALTASSTIAINVTAINDAPAGDDNTVVALEDGDHVFNVADFLFDDALDTPANDILAVQISTLPSAGVLENNGVAVLAGQSVSAADIAAGRLVFRPDADGSGASYASFTFQVQDDGGTVGGGVDLDLVARTMTIDVDEVNDAPQGADHTVGALEDLPYVFQVSDFGFSDPVDGGANSLAAVRVSSLPSAGTLTSNGVAVNAGDLISFADISAGSLKFTAAADASGAAYAAFTFQLQDDGGTANGGFDLDPTARTLTIDVAAVNDAPQGTDNTVTLLEDATYVFANVDFGFTDTHDAPADAQMAVVIVALPVDGSLMLNGVAVAAGDTISQVDIAAGNLQYTPLADASGAGYASFTFQVKDDGGTAGGGADLDPTARVITLDVTAVNDSPTVSANAAPTVASGGSVVIGNSNLSVADPDNSTSQVVYTLKALPAGGSLMRSGTALALNGTFTQADIDSLLVRYVHAGVTSGSDSFSLSVADGAGGTLGPLTFTVSITAPPPVTPTPPVVVPTTPTPPTTPTTPTTPGSGTSTPPATTTPSTPSTPSGGTSGGTTPTGGSGGGAGAQPVEGAPGAAPGGAAAVPDAVAAALAGDNRSHGSSGASPAKAQAVPGPIALIAPGGGLTLGGAGLGIGLAQNPNIAALPTETMTISASDPGFARAPDPVRLEVYRSSLGNKDLAVALDSMRQQAGADAQPVQKIAVGSTVAVTGAMSVGYVIWLLRGGLLISSLLSSLPAWSVIDPMPVLARSGRSDDEIDDDPLEKIFGRAKAAVGLGRKTAPAPAEPAVPDAGHVETPPPHTAAAVA